MARIIFTLEDLSKIETELTADRITIGRLSENGVMLPSASVSGHHATIKRRGDAYFVQDHGSTNGTKINGVEVDEVKLENGDRLFFGDVSAVFQLRDLSVKKKDPVEPQPEVQSGDDAATSSRSWGCARYFLIFTFIIMAFAAGLMLAHAVKYQRFLLPDIIYSEPVRKYFGNITEEPVRSGDRDKSKAANEEQK
ncbi:MAG: FHA domain-containing protein [Verrucomicrobia bacterium]|nr:FHA domain-containing protein [Verrucomicrobiota bacterium]